MKARCDGQVREAGRREHKNISTEYLCEIQMDLLVGERVVGIMRRILGSTAAMAS